MAGTVNSNVHKYYGGLVPEPTPSEGGDGKTKLLVTRDVTIVIGEHPVTKKLLCDPDSVTTVEPNIEVVTAQKLAGWLAENYIVELDDGDQRVGMLKAATTQVEDDSVCTSIVFKGLKDGKRASIEYACSEVTDESTLMSYLEVGPAVVHQFGKVLVDGEDTVQKNLEDAIIADELGDIKLYTGERESSTPENPNKVLVIDDSALRERIGNVEGSVESVLDTLDEMDVDSIPHAYLGSSLAQSAGDNVTSSTAIDVFKVFGDLVGDCFEFEQTTTIDDTPFGYVWIEPGTYLVNATVTLQWVGQPAGTFQSKVGKVMGENFDFSFEQEIQRNSTRIVTIDTRRKLSLSINYDAEIPVMGFWIQSLQVVKLAGGMSATTVTHDNTLTGTGTPGNPLGISDDAKESEFNYIKNREFFAEKTELTPLATRSALQAETSRAINRENEIEALFTLPTQEMVNAWLDAHPEATSTVQDHSLTEEKFTDELKLKTIKDYLTPQMFGASGDGVHDDTEAFRNMLVEANRQATTGFGTFKGCQKVYIPSGNYLITDTIVYQSLGVAPCAFEIFGAGRENTIINFTGSVLLENYNVFAFSTFHDIGFVGNNSNIFLRMTETSSYGVQRINFISCRFSGWQSIVFTVQSSSNMSECTFTMCKIHSCGTDENLCSLFVLDNPQLVNWRFVATDIETFKGTAFDFRSGAAISLYSCSIIPLSSDSVVFNATNYHTQTEFGPANSPNVSCYSVRFELRNNSSLLSVSGFRRTAFDEGSVFSLVFTASDFNLIGSLATSKFIKAVGAFNFIATCCCGISGFNIDYTSISAAFSNPKISFVNCLDNIDFDHMKTASVINLVLAYQDRNAPHIIVDNKYSFIMSSASPGFVKDFVGDRRYIDFFNNSYGSNYITTTGKTESKFVFGYVSKLDIYISRASSQPNCNLTLELRDDNDSVVASQQVSLTGTKHTVSVPVNSYIGLGKLSVSHDYSGLLYIDMLAEMECV